MGLLRHAGAPCAECPWRRDQPAGRFSAERYELLRSSCQDQETGETAPMDAPMFACHKSLEGREIACAGWLAVEGSGHVRVRLAVVRAEISIRALEPGEGWPELYPSFAELARVNGVE